MPGAATQTVTVVVVDDHAVFAQSLAAALNAVNGITVADVAHNGAEAIEKIGAHLPDVVLLDLQLPDVQGVDLIGPILTASPGSRIVVLTASVDARTALVAIDAGCLGYVTKDQGLDEVLAAVRAVAAGQAVVPSNVLTRAIPGRGQSQRPALTRRELEILELLAVGASNEHISEKLGVARNTIRNHVQNLLVKLDAHSRLEAVAIARREHILAQRGLER